MYTFVEQALVGFAILLSMLMLALVIKSITVSGQWEYCYIDDSVLYANVDWRPDPRLKTDNDVKVLQEHAKINKCELIAGVTGQ